MKDTVRIHEEMPMPKKIRLEIPVGAIESDSGDYLLDILGIVFIVLMLYIGKKLIDVFFNWILKEKE